MNQQWLRQGKLSVNLPRIMWLISKLHWLRRTAYQQFVNDESVYITRLTDCLLGYNIKLRSVYCYSREALDSRS